MYINEIEIFAWKGILSQEIIHRLYYKKEREREKKRNIREEKKFIESRIDCVCLGNENKRKERDILFENRMRISK